MTYTISEHQHRFAIWTAARATQRGFRSTSDIQFAIENICLRNIIEQTDHQPKNSDEFDRWHYQQCKKLINELNKTKTNATFGRAAKIVAIYLKTRLLMCSEHLPTITRFIHPPIDRVLLKNLAKKYRNKDPIIARHWSKIAWTKLNAKEYKHLIDDFRERGLDQPAFWRIEEYWSPSGELNENID